MRESERHTHTHTPSSSKALRWLKIDSEQFFCPCDAQQQTDCTHTNTYISYTHITTHSCTLSTCIHMWVAVWVNVGALKEVQKATLNPIHHSDHQRKREWISRLVNWLLSDFGVDFLPPFGANAPDSVSSPLKWFFSECSTHHVIFSSQTSSSFSSFSLSLSVFSSSPKLVLFLDFPKV